MVVGDYIIANDCESSALQACDLLVQFGIKREKEPEDINYQDHIPSVTGRN